MIQVTGDDSNAPGWCLNMVRQELWGKADHSIPRITWVTEDPASKNTLQWTMARVTGDGSDAPGWCLNMVEQEHWENNIQIWCNRSTAEKLITAYPGLQKSQKTKLKEMLVTMKSTWFASSDFKFKEVPVTFKFENVPG